MRKLVFRRPSPAMLVAVVALVSSLAGPAVAEEVARMAQSITGKNVRNSTLTGADIRNNTLSGADIRNGGIDSVDIGAGEVETVDLGDNAVRGDKIQAGTVAGTDILDNSLTGFDIDEGTLDGEAIVRYQRRFFFRMAGGERREILTHRNIRLVANCVNNGEVNGTSGQDAVRILTDVLAGGALQTSDTGDDYQGPGRLGGPAADDQKELFVHQAGDGQTMISSNVGNAQILGPEDEAITFGGAEGIVAAVNANGAECTISGVAKILN